MPPIQRAFTCVSNGGGALTTRAFVKTLVKGLKWFKNIKTCVFITIRGAPPHNKLWDKFKGGFIWF